MSAKATSKLTPEQQKATMTRVLQKIRPYGFFVVCSLIVAAVSVAAQLYIPILCGNAIDMMLGKGAVDFAGVLRIIYEIIVLDDGRMVGLGRHADLLKTCPVYEEIYASQFKKGDAQK